MVRNPVSEKSSTGANPDLRTHRGKPIKLLHSERVIRCLVYSRSTKYYSSHPPEPTRPMEAHEKLALVIPALREAKSLPRLLAEIRAVLEGSSIPYEILVVDDHSRDGTEELVSSIAGYDARVRLLVRRHERGLAGAILHGW